MFLRLEKFPMESFGLSERTQHFAPKVAPKVALSALPFLLSLSARTKNGFFKRQKTF